ncbi:peptidoglycan DD-metalloendopeptidase family protein [Streptomyces chartreusis]|uniref:aggregation-promoting factor C-terminal-like domain-containing protein n=1 Tax=Streptomyces chartreusis TaxID=1969 RepID=UPI0033ED9FCE
MAGDLDIVGGAAVDVVPIVPNFHTKLRQAVLPIADSVGAEAGRKMGERMADTMRASLVGDAQRIGNDLGDAIGDAMARRIVTALPNAINTGGQAARRASSRQGDANAGAFARSFENRLRAAFQSLPRPDVRLNDTGFNADLARLRARMETLSNKRIGVDIDAATAIAEMQAIDAKLAELGSRSPNIQVRADIATARAELAAMQRQINDLDRDDVNIRVRANTAQAHAALLQLAVSLGVVAALPVIPIAAAGIGAIFSAAVTATAGVGALALAAVPAIMGVTKAIQAKNAAEKESESASNNSAAAGVRAAQAAIQMENAQQALANAHRNAARSIAQANRQVEDAERALGQAAARAMEQRRQAAERIEDAERSLLDAKRQARQAEEDLTQARADAARKLADLNDQLERGKLDERDATLRVKEAQEELNRVTAEYDAGLADELDLERAQLAFDQATQAAKDQQKEYAKLQTDAEAAKKAGVDGNEQVKTAAEKLADAQQNVREQTEAVTDAQREAAQAQVDAAQQVAEAQRNLADAVTNVADTQVQAAQSIESAERGVESARLSSINTTEAATTKADEYRKALAKLTPEQRALYASIAGPGGLTEAFKAWSKELQPDVLPLFTRAVNGAKSSLPGLSPLVRNSADAIGELMDRASRDFKNPFWQRFKKGIAENAKPAIVGLGISFGNVFKGMAGITDAFFPHMESISERMQKITGRFAKWGTSLRGSPAFEKFLAYVSEHGPIVAEAFGDIGGGIFDLAKALEPFSTVILELLGYVGQAISYVSEHAPWAIQLIYGLWIATRLWTLAMAANPVGLVIMGLVGLALAVKYAWDHFEWFRDIVRGAWDGIRVAADFAWTKVLKPAFDGISGAVQWVGDKMVWLWQEVFKPAWDGIVFAAKLAFAIIVTAVLTPIWLAIQLVGAIAMWLWTDAFKPTFDGIAWLVKWVWDNVLSPTFGFLWDGVKWVGDKFVWLYDHAVKPAFNWIGDKAKWLWENALKPVFGWLWDGIKWVGDKFVWLYDHTVKPVWNWVSDKTDWVWEKGLKPAFKLMKDGVGLLGDAFEAAKDAIKSAWDQLKDITKAPVNFIIKWVYTKGIKAVWDKVAGFVGLDPLPAAPKLLEAGGTVGNGWGPAVPMKTNRPTAIVGEGNPRYPEYVIPTDPKYRSRALALHQAAGTQLLESGGILGGFQAAWDWTKDTVGDVVGKGIDWAKAGADLLTNPSKIWNKLVSPVLNKVADGVGTAPIGKALTKIPTKMVGGLKDKIVNAVSSMFAGGGLGGGQWVKPVNAGYGTKFGVAGSMWASGHHTGLDFPAPTGTPVRAVAGGNVSATNRGGPYGNHIIVNHGGGLQSLYAHLSRIRVAVPKIVDPGDRLGDVGATGNVTGPHLHLEARLNGRAVDPMPYLTGGGGFSANAVGAAQKYAKSILGNYGWGESQFGPLKKLWQGESGWRWNAKNPSSGAYGIPQALPASKMASAGSDWQTNAKTQIRWGLNYIKNRPDYGSPAAAYSKWLSRSPHWYDDGGYIPPGLSLVANGTGKPEPVFTSGQWADIRSSKGGGASTIHADVKVFVGDREITDIVRTEINTYDSEVATDLNNGRWG